MAGLRSINSSMATEIELERSRSGSIFIDGTANVLVSAGASSSHGVLMSIEGITYVACTAHGLFHRGPGRTLTLMEPLKIQIQGTGTDIEWSCICSWLAFAESSDPQYDCALISVRHTAEMKPVVPFEEACLSERVSNIGIHSERGDYVASSRVVQEDEFTCLLSPGCSFPGLSGLGMLSSEGSLIGIVQATGYATGVKNIFLRAGYYSPAYLKLVAIKTDDTTKFEPVFTFIVKVASVIRLFNEQSNTFHVKKFFNLERKETPSGSDGKGGNRNEADRQSAGKPGESEKRPMEDSSSSDSARHKRVKFVDGVNCANSSSKPNEEERNHIILFGGRKEYFDETFV